MIKNIKKLFNISLVVLGSIMLLNCEPEADNFGDQLFVGDAAEGNVQSFPIIAYNIDNGDKVRSDATRLRSAVLGAFDEPVFGKQKASYVTQLRMQSYDPDFGTNPVLDSVVMVIKPLYSSDSVTTTTNDGYVYPDGNVAAKLVQNTYPVKKYGKTKLNGGKTIFNIRVHEVNDFLKSTADSVYSNVAYNYNTLLGSKVFDGTVSSVKITKDSDNSELVSRDANLRINLDKNFFKTKILDKKGSVDLKDVAGFIRYFKGIRISVDENDGYIFTFSPDDAEIVMYYKYDKTENGVTTRPQTTFKLSMGSGNVHVGQYEYVRAGTALETALASSNPASGDLKIFAQGMGGPGIGIKIAPGIVTELKKLYKENKAGIISAKIRLYSDTALWNNTYAKPDIFTILQKDVFAFLPEMSVLSQSSNFSLVKPYDLDKNPAYYDFTITKTLKNIVETEAANKDYTVNVGSFLTNLSSSTGNLLGYNYTSNPYTPNRIVLVGTDTDNPNRATLRVIYGTK